jgi:8-oxo-dGTP diphosphatase
MKRGRIRVAAYALCVDEEERVLLCRIAAGQTASGRWTLPGGGVEFGEDPADAVLRELGEETGLAGQVGPVVTVASSVLPRRRWAGGEDVHNLALVYRVTIVGGRLRDKVGGSSDQCAWLSTAEAQGLPLTALAEDAVRLAFTEGSRA